ncbi:MAG: glycine betaine ABC transporter substrate-binding protein [Planctomycetota bacterium]|nr:glycine betaine ABC transporter substrate-binding protein [Planctomycetota bacterium]
MSTKTKFLILAVIVVAIAGTLTVTKIFLVEHDVLIGGKDFTEQSVLGEMLAILIEENTDLTVGRKLYLGGTMICFNALNAGDLDLYAEYTGTGLVNILKRNVINDPQQAYLAVRKDFEKKYGLIWLKPFGFNNTYTLTMRRGHAEKLGIRSFSDLAAYVRKQKEAESGDRLTAGFTAEFIERPDGLKGLCKAYDLEFESEPMQMDPGLMYKACADGDVDVICAFATDGRIAAYDLFVLKDDKRFFPPYYAAPLIRAQTLARHPELEEILNRLANKLNNETMRKLNLQVDREDNPRRARDVARDFLIDASLIPSKGGAER